MFNANTQKSVRQTETTPQYAVSTATHTRVYTAKQNAVEPVHSSVQSKQ